MSASPSNADKTPYDLPPYRVRLTLAALTLLILLIVAVVSALTRRPSAPPLPPADLPTARLLYSVVQNGGSARYSRDVTSGETRLLSSAWEGDIDRPSPDGRWRVRWEESQSYYESALVLQDAEGMERTLGLFAGIDGLPSWSPNSQSLVFGAFPPDTPEEAMEEKRMELWQLDITSGTLARLTQNDVMDSHPAFSPDGTQIVYTSDADGFDGLFVMVLDSRIIYLITPENDAYSAAWSPDGQWIAFVTLSPYESGYQNDIWLVRPDGSQLQPVITSPAMETQPAWLVQSS